MINVLFRYLKLTREHFPRLSVVRKVLPDGARYLGPFHSSGQAELVKAAIEDALPLRRCTARLGARGGGSPCALLELRRCLGPCTGAVPQETYAALVGRLEAALDGDPEPLLAPLREKMWRYAGEQRYEQAAAARDRLEALTRALAEARRRSALAGAEEIVLAVPHPAGREVTVIRRGQLAGVAVLAADDHAGVERLLAAAGDCQPFDGPPPRQLADEVGLVVRWLEATAGKGELLGVRGRLASLAAGGATLQVRYDPGRHRRAWPPGEARGRPELRPARRARLGSAARTGRPARHATTVFDGFSGSPAWR
jgi:DNA polymerase III subunit epsilon